MWKVTESWSKNWNNFGFLCHDKLITVILDQSQDIVTGNAHVSS